MIFYIFSLKLSVTILKINKPCLNRIRRLIYTSCPTYTNGCSLLSTSIVGDLPNLPPPPSFQGNPHLNLQCFWYLVLVIEILIDLSLRFIISTGKIILCLFKIFINCEAAQPIFIMLCTSIRDVVTISQIGKYALYFFLKLARIEDICFILSHEFLLSPCMI